MCAFGLCALPQFWFRRLLLTARTTFQFYQTKAAAQCLLDHSYKNSCLFSYSFSWASSFQRSLVITETNESRPESRADIISMYSILTNVHYFPVNSTIKKQFCVNIIPDSLLIWAVFLCDVEVLHDSCLTVQFHTKLSVSLQGLIKQRHTQFIAKNTESEGLR